MRAGRAGSGATRLARSRRASASRTSSATVAGARTPSFCRQTSRLTPRPPTRRSPATSRGEVSQPGGPAPDRGVPTSRGETPAARDICRSRNRPRQAAWGSAHSGALPAASTSMRALESAPRPALPRHQGAGRPKGVGSVYAPPPGPGPLSAGECPSPRPRSLRLPESAAPSYPDASSATRQEGALRSAPPPSRAHKASSLSRAAVMA